MAAIIRLAPPTAALCVDRYDAPATCNAPVPPGEVMSSPGEVGQMCSSSSADTSGINLLFSRKNSFAKFHFWKRRVVRLYEIIEVWKFGEH